MLKTKIKKMNKNNCKEISLQSKLVIA